MFRWWMGKLEYEDRVFARLNFPFWLWWAIGWAIILPGWTLMFWGAHLALVESHVPALASMGAGISLTLIGNIIGGRGTVLWDRRQKGRSL